MKTNPYLRDTAIYERLLTVNVTSSTAIELGSVNPSIIKALKKKRQPRFTYSPGEK